MSFVEGKHTNEINEIGPSGYSIPNYDACRERVERERERGFRKSHRPITVREPLYFSYRKLKTLQCKDLISLSPVGNTFKSNLTTQNMMFSV